MLPISEEQHVDNSSSNQQNANVTDEAAAAAAAAAAANGLADDKAALAADASLWTALYDYDAQGEDELTLRRGQIVVVLSTDSEVSGDVGWWTGKIGDKVNMHMHIKCNWLLIRAYSLARLVFFHATL